MFPRESGVWERILRRLELATAKKPLLLGKKDYLENQEKAQKILGKLKKSNLDALETQFNKVFAKFRDYKKYTELAKEEEEERAKRMWRNQADNYFTLFGKELDKLWNNNSTAQPEEL